MRERAWRTAGLGSGLVGTLQRASFRPADDRSLSAEPSRSAAASAAHGVVRSARVSHQLRQRGHDGDALPVDQEYCSHRSCWGRRYVARSVGGRSSRLAPLIVFVLFSIMSLLDRQGFLCAARIRGTGGVCCDLGGWMACRSRRCSSGGVHDALQRRARAHAGRAHQRACSQRVLAQLPLSNLLSDPAIVVEASELLLRAGAALFGGCRCRCSESLSCWPSGGLSSVGDVCPDDRDSDGYSARWRDCPGIVDDRSPSAGLRALPTIESALPIAVPGDDSRSWSL